MALSAADWKKTKAKTLIGETVTPALAEAEKLYKTMFVADTTASGEDLSRLTGSLKSLQVEIKKTRAKCKKGIHDATAKYLDQMNNEAANVLAAVQKKQVEWNSLLKSFDLYVKHTRSALEAVVKAPQPTVIARSRVPVEGALKWMQDNSERFARADDQRFVKRMMDITKASTVFDQLLAAQPKAQAAGKPLPASPAALKKPLDEAQKLIKNLR